MSVNFIFSVVHSRLIQIEVTDAAGTIFSFQIGENCGSVPEDISEFENVIKNSVLDSVQRRALLFRKFELGSENTFYYIYPHSSFHYPCLSYWLSPKEFENILNAYTKVNLVICRICVEHLPCFSGTGIEDVQIIKNFCRIYVDPTLFSNSVVFCENCEGESKSGETLCWACKHGI